MTPLAFRVYGVALPKGNMKPIIRDKRGMKIAVATESNRNVRGWQQLIAEGASRALNERGAPVLFEYGVFVTARFYLPRPKKYSRRGVFVAHCTNPDVDKLARAVLDALTGIVYRDDCQVTELAASKYYAEVNGPAYVDIRIETAAAALASAVSLERRRSLFDEVAP